MMDQAATLRRTVAEEAPSPKATRVMAVSSGKGGVGKTNTVVNLAVAFSRMGQRVLLMDADLGLGNIDVLLGLAPRHNISHLLKGEKTIDEVLVAGPAGVMILPAASGVCELTSLTIEDRLGLQSHLDNMDEAFDIMIIDTGAGISNNVLFFNVSAQDVLVVVTPEPTSITDAYALMKVMMKKHGERKFKLLVNSAKTKKDALEVYRKLSLAAMRFLDVSVDYMGCVLHDENVPRSVVMQKPVLELYPDTRASLCYLEVARQIYATPAVKELKGGMQFFWRQMLARGL